MKTCLKYPCGNLSDVRLFFSSDVIGMRYCSQTAAPHPVQFMFRTGNQDRVTWRIRGRNLG